MILAGDIGGTKTVLALFEESGDGLQEVRAETFPSRQHATFDELLKEFTGGKVNGALRSACFGVAGVVIDGRCHTTNLPWELDEQSLAGMLRVPRVKLLNDLEAAAYGMLFLPPEELCVLNEGERADKRGNVAVIAAGTGLGEAFLFWDGRHHWPVASEGGHADFAPQNDREMELLRYLRGKHGPHVSYERVLSGPGFFDVYCFLRDGNYYPEAPWLAEQIAAGEPNPAIAQAGMAGKDPLAAATLDLCLTVYGAEAGNLAMKCVAVGGVFVGGGIAPKLLPALQTGGFLRGFTSKGRFSEFVKKIRVSVALNPRAPLLGAARFAAREP